MAISVFVLAVSLMFAGAQGISQSQSCSMINGKMICNSQTSEGNTAMSSASSFSGPGSTYQNTNAAAGNPGNMQTSGQTISSGSPSASSDISVNYDASGFQDTDGGYGGFNGGYTYTSAGSFPPNAAFPPAAGGFGFASAGAFPFPIQIPFMVPGFAYPPQDFAAPTAGNPPQPGNPFSFTNGFMMGGFPGGGAFAGAGAFPFGRR